MTRRVEEVEPRGEVVGRRRHSERADARPVDRDDADVVDRRPGGDGRVRRLDDDVGFFAVDEVDVEGRVHEAAARHGRDASKIRPVEVPDLGSKRVLPLSPSNSRVFERSHPVKKKAFTLRDLEER